MAHRADGIETALRAALIEARRAGDRRVAAALRGALAAIDNAGAVAAPEPARTVARNEHIAGTAGPLGAGEAPRAVLSADAVRAIVATDIEERRAAAREYDDRGQDAAATDLRTEADVLAAVLASCERAQP